MALSKHKRNTNNYEPGSLVVNKAALAKCHVRATGNAPERGGLIRGRMLGGRAQRRDDA